nr:bifunctional oligoribonuclease/PAP phosphatase NrnA [Desulfobulbaceae bacterium]
MSGDQLNKIVETIQAAKAIVLATHVFPDGDALGALIGFGHILEGLGKKVVLYSDESVSYLYDFLPGSEKIVTTLPSSSEVDCAIALDCGDQFRLGKILGDLLKIEPLLVIDHHTGHKKFGDLRWVDSSRSSTGEMVFELGKLLGADLSNEAAFCLYTAIVSDTGSFKYASTLPRTVEIAGELVRKGVNPEIVAGKLFDNFTESRLHLLQSVLSTLELFCDGRLAIITATKKMFEITQALPEDSETFINYPRALCSVEIAVFLKEANGLIGVSMRSKGDHHDVAEIARKLGGGGHRKAAGCKFKKNETLKEAREMLFNLLLPLFE